MTPCPLTTFILSYAIAPEMLGARLAVTAAITVVATIGGIALAAAMARNPGPSRLELRKDCASLATKTVGVADPATSQSDLLALY
jgi:hypothetical protein